MAYLERSNASSAYNRVNRPPFAARHHVVLCQPISEAISLSPEREGTIVVHEIQELNAQNPREVQSPITKVESRFALTVCHGNHRRYSRTW